MAVAVEGAAEGMFRCADGDPIITEVEVEVGIKLDNLSFVAVAVVDSVADQKEFSLVGYHYHTFPQTCCVGIVGAARKQGGVFGIAVHPTAHAGVLHCSTVVSFARVTPGFGISYQSAHLGDALHRTVVWTAVVICPEPSVLTQETDDAAHLVDALHFTAIGRLVNLAAVQQGTYDSTHIARIGFDFGSGFVVAATDGDPTDTGTRNTAGIVTGRILGFITERIIQGRPYVAGIGAGVDGSIGHQTADAAHVAVALYRSTVVAVADGTLVSQADETTADAAHRVGSNAQLTLRRGFASFDLDNMSLTQTHNTAEIYGHFLAIPLDAGVAIDDGRIAETALDDRGDVG